MLQVLKNMKASVWMGMLVLVLGGCLGASNCFAGDSDDSAMKIKEIEQPPAATPTTPAVHPEMPKGTHYFAKGTVDAKGDNWITINDHEFSIAPGSSVSCGVGDFVGIQVNDEGKVVSCESVRK